ncbi:copper chaperone CopZ [Chitinophaga dinghuensis]|uniref:Mercuric transport protein MerT n=1 Tax=Chitinophaga dinghuensis TaxID=1539050 RepID=A0A327VXJ7_9BACT|nr:mercuric transport protein MerTP [Chitinophaga dinghuensis]RAJ80222.1 copper chaperone CopZ [Chitinophaga dinghuensis]
MMKGKNNKVLLGSGLLLALTSSLCCIVPLLAILGGAGGAVAAFGWAAPLRPYMLAATVLVLGFAFYQAYKPQSKDDCGCEPAKKSWMQSKAFLWIVAAISLLLSAFPYYESYFHPQIPAKEKMAENIPTIQQTTLHISGMSCEACEGHVNNALRQQKGVLEANTNYAKGIAVVKFDSTLISFNQMAAIIEDETGYQVAR